MSGRTHTWSRLRQPNDASFYSTSSRIAEGNLSRYSRIARPASRYHVSTINFNSCSCRAFEETGTRSFASTRKTCIHIIIKSTQFFIVFVVFLLPPGPDLRPSKSVMTGRLANEFHQTGCVHLTRYKDQYLVFVELVMYQVGDQFCTGKILH